MASLPRRKSATRVTTIVSEVVMLRPIVCMRLWLTISSMGSPSVALPVLADPVEHDDRVMDGEADDGEHRGHEQRVDLEVDERPRRAKTPTVTMTSWSSATMAVTPMRKSRKRYVIQAMIASARDEDEQERLLDELVADDRPDGVLLAHLVDAAEAILERGRELAEAALRGHAGDGRLDRCRPRRSVRHGGGGARGRGRSAAMRSGRGRGRRGGRSDWSDAEAAASTGSGRCG